ncbi:molybdopterin oxidoreductase family protein [Nonomuraea sediminis]|uniref:molybdopterin oxidoreductase family protein n=1 Tax=Nonomuraea sediminis TaxID=2835864 RepID=UPI001BDC2BF5|nr:molybdopterin-dependent oxidoreductase [Nonomuraea sediminis]
MNDRIADPWGERTPYGPGERWPVRQDQLLTVDADVEWVPTASVLHSNGDAMELAVLEGQIVGVRGRADDRVNHGRLGPKDLYGWQANHSPDRLTTPLVREGGRLVPASWDAAMDLIAAHSRELLREGPERFGFYTSGQLFLEEYYTLAVLATAGIGTPHLDGNTRLCTATAASALKASFGTDGQPGSYTDVDFCDALALWGHNVAETQTVLWSRMLDRRRGPTPPAMIAVDPRQTPVAREADVHLAVRPGTNLALVNALIRRLIDRGWYDPGYVDAHTIGFEDLQRVTADYPVERAAQICGLEPRLIEQAAEILGTCQALVSTVLQGFYQSHQATAAACQVNNVHLLRGMLGRPGAGVLQMNGQPTAQNTRETGADGDLPGMRNWANPRHVEELAELWNVDAATLPQGRPTHAMEIFRKAEEGDIRLLWISATNPAVSLPELPRIRRLLSDPALFVVVQDIFMTETAMLADVVLPAAAWGEKRGTFTNADRTVHLSEQAVQPPGQARSDLDIFCDYAARMNFRDQDGKPLIQWSTAEQAFEAWQACSAGRPCDYTDLGYERLREGGIQWGGERLYIDGRFNTDTDYCETYGQDMITGEPQDEAAHRAKNPAGRAFLHAVPYQPPPEQPDDDYPMLLTTGRTVYHFHTRTKTARVPELDRAAPRPWIEISAEDAARLAVQEGDLVRVETRRGAMEAPARIAGLRPGTLFAPFHYGYWDAGTAGPHDGPPTAANEATLTAWDPVSKQPIYKLSAARLIKA